MRTLLEDAISKAAQGLTTLEAILQVVSPDDESAATQGTVNPGDPGAIPRESELGITRSHPEAIADTVRDQGRQRDRILIVEDNSTVTSVVKYFLELEGFEVLLAADGRAGLEAAHREKPSVIVTDVNMPEMDGFEMLKALRANPATRDVAILMLTSEDSLESETRALSAGADDYILKPVEPRRLAARVKALLARSKGRQPASTQ
jgi:PleD family two-component response regulator